jgi:hypothetical protein
MVLGSESPSEKEGRIQKREERLERQHERVKEMRQLPKEGAGGGGPNMGSNSKIGQYISEHRWEFAIGLIATVVVGYIFFRAQSGSAGTTATVGSTNAASGGSANNQGSLAAAGYDTSGVAYALTQESQQLTDLQNQLNTQGIPATTTNTNTTNITNSTVPLQWSLPPIFPSGTTISGSAKLGEYATTPGGTKVTLLNPGGGAGLLPQGTIVQQGGSGRWWYTEPGGYQQSLTPTNGYTGNVLGVTKLGSGIYQVGTPQNPGTINK